LLVLLLYTTVHGRLIYIGLRFVGTREARQTFVGDNKIKVRRNGLCW